MECNLKHVIELSYALYRQLKMATLEADMKQCYSRYSRWGGAGWAVTQIMAIYCPMYVKGTTHTVYIQSLLYYSRSSTYRVLQNRVLWPSFDSRLTFELWPYFGRDKEQLPCALSQKMSHGFSQFSSNGGSYGVASTGTSWEFTNRTSGNRQKWVQSSEVSRVCCESNDACDNHFAKPCKVYSLSSNALLMSHTVMTGTCSGPHMHSLVLPSWLQVLL